MDETVRTTTDPARNAPSHPEQTVCSTTSCACPVCGGALVDIRMKLQCSRCHTIVETCCEGGPG